MIRFQSKKQCRMDIEKYCCANAKRRISKKKSNMLWLLKRKYRHYDGLTRALENRYKLYNETLSYIEEQERQGNIFVIRPQSPLVVGRIEKNRERLDALYNQGYKEAEAQFASLQNWMNS